MKLTFFYCNICQLAKNGYLNIKNSYIQAILRESKELIAKIKYLEFENKTFLKSSKTQKKAKYK